MNLLDKYNIIWIYYKYDIYIDHKGIWALGSRVHSP